jgi:hypothetical protein
MACECRIVGDLEIGLNGVFSINVSTNAKISKTTDGVIVKAPKERTITISAYPFMPGESDKTGCPVKINSHFKWTKVYSCDDDIYYYMYQRIGNISSLGDVIPDLITFDNLIYQGIGYSASATSGPYSYYIGDEVNNAFSMEYTGNPITFNSANQEDMVMGVGNIASRAFLINFTYTGGMGSNVPVVTYTFEASDAEILDGPVVQCDSISITYDVHGVATISMVVYSNDPVLDIAGLPKTFGEVEFKVTGASLDLSQVPFSDYYKFNVTMVGIGV